MNDTLTKLTKKIGDFVAEQFKDADNELFDDISDVVITDFIDEIKKDNPVLGSWVEDWKNKNTKAGKPKKTMGVDKHKTQSSYCGGCGSTTFYGGC